jgi:hypothetical protein
MGAVRRAIQSSSDGLRAVSKRYGINPKAVLPSRQSEPAPADLPTGPRAPRSMVLSPEDEAVMVAFHHH